MDDERAGLRQGGPLEFIRPICPHAFDLVGKRRPGAHRAANHQQIVPNRIIKEAIANTRTEVTDGKTIAQPLARSKIFPQLMVDLLKIGEETGNVPGALQNIADTYENELTIALKVMTALIEPVMLVVMAA